MIKLKSRVNEVIPFDKSDIVKVGLEKRYGVGELGAYTFGIEFEFAPSSTDEVDEDKLRMELENNSRVHDDFEEWLEVQRHESNDRLRKVDDWDNSYGPMDVDTYDDLVIEPEMGDYDDEDVYKEEYKNWEDQRKNIVDEYKRWERGDRSNTMDEYITKLIRFDDWENYVNRDNISDMSSIEDDILDVTEYIRKEMGENVQPGDSTVNGWGVGPDGKNVEIRSKHLNQSEFDLVKKICNYVAKQNVSGGTSAHVHIGLPADFDSFDLLAITTLVDEREIQNQVGPDRELSSWAQLRSALHNKIVDYLIRSTENQETKEKSFIIDNNKLFSILNGLGRNYGTNISAMRSKGTIEFRYLSSQIAKNSDIFIKWIQYYLLLPKVAKSRNIVVLKQSVGSDSQNVTAVRGSGNIKFVLNSKTSTLNLPASTLKSRDVPWSSPKVDQLKKDKLSKIST